MSSIVLYPGFIWNCLISDSNIGNICRRFKNRSSGGKRRRFSHQGNTILEENRLSGLLLWRNTDRSSIRIITVRATWTLIRRSYGIAICYIVLSMRAILVYWYCLRSTTIRWESAARVKENRDLVYPYVIRSTAIRRHFLPSMIDHRK